MVTTSYPVLQRSYCKKNVSERLVSIKMRLKDIYMHSAELYQSVAVVFLLIGTHTFDNLISQTVFGYGSTDAMPFRQTREGELHFVEDGDTNLANIACGTHIPHQIGKTTVKGIHN